MILLSAYFSIAGCVHDTDPRFMRTNFFARSASLVYSQMLIDNTDLVSMEFRIHRLHFWPVEYQSTLVNMDEVARTSDVARGRQAVYSCITFSDIW